MGRGGPGGLSERTAAYLGRRLLELGQSGDWTEDVAKRFVAAADKQQAAAAKQKRAAEQQERVASGKNGSYMGLGTSNLAINALTKQMRGPTNDLSFQRSQDRFNNALNLQTEILRRIEAKNAFNTYRSQASELRSLGYNAPANPYRGYRSIQGAGPQRFRRYSEGGFVDKPTNALIGEGGENEYVIPASKMDSAMGRYAKGVRGEAVVEGSAKPDGKGGVKGKAVVNVNTGPVMRMNNKDYVTVNDMNSALGSVVAAMSDSGGSYKGSARVG